jgi:O-antigen ligase
VSRRAGEVAAPIYLFLCLLLGGSAQGVFANMFLQLLGLGLLAWAALISRPEQASRVERRLYVIILLTLLLVAIQLVPLPSSIWPHLGGRAEIAGGYAVLDIPIPWLPVSLAPYDSLATVLTLIPPLALMMVILRTGTRSLWLVAALLAGLIGGILLGVLQVSNLGDGASPWYLYPETNVGVATGFFANANHMATLLVISIPFLAALVVSARKRSVQRYSGTLVLVAAAGVVVIVGIALNGSLAGYGLAVPVILASILLVLPRRSRARGWLAIAAGIFLAAAIAWLTFMPVGSSAIRSETHTSVQSRQEILATSLSATRAFMPFGSGLGTFRSVYALYEDHDRLDPTTSVNHAHDDYVELAMETGVPGILLIALFVAWWAAAALQTWRTGDSGAYRRAAAIASAAILVHSIVDFPLRTAAIATCFAMCLAIMIRSRPTPATTGASDIRPTRHVVID